MTICSTASPTSERWSAAARRAIRGKRRKPGAAAFMANLETEALRLERELHSRRWRSGGFVTFRVCDPKPRLVSAAPFRDRVVHHALCAVVEPIFERGFIADRYANGARAGKRMSRLARLAAGSAVDGIAWLPVHQQPQEIVAQRRGTTRRKVAARWKLPPRRRAVICWPQQASAAPLCRCLPAGHQETQNVPKRTRESAGYL